MPRTADMKIFQCQNRAHSPFAKTTEAGTRPALSRSVNTGPTRLRLLHGARPDYPLDDTDLFLYASYSLSQRVKVF